MSGNLAQHLSLQFSRTPGCHLLECNQSSVSQAALRAALSGGTRTTARHVCVTGVPLLCSLCGNEQRG